MKRFRFRGIAAILLCIVPVACGGGSGASSSSSNPEQTTMPTTGPSVPGAAAFDQSMTALMRRWNIPGASVAVTRNGRLILARGYGYADQSTGALAQPDSLYRIASISKTFTATAILHLVEQGRLSLDDRFLDILTQYQLPAGADQRLRDVTLRHLLQHSAGFGGTDPMFDSANIANALHVSAPATADSIIRYMLGRPLTFTPGTNYSYSNFGYCILGRVIEKVTGQNYERYMRDTILAPMNIHAMRIGASLESGRAPGEVRYYDPSVMDSVFPGGGRVPFAYGGFYLEAMDSHGGWIASAIDLTRFATALDGQRGTAFLSPSSLQQMTAKPSIPFWANWSTGWYGMGMIYETNQHLWWHNGSLPGTVSLMVHTEDGYTWAMLANLRPDDFGRFTDDLKATMYAAVHSGLEGSSTDLYLQFPSPELGPSH